MCLDSNGHCVSGKAATQFEHHGRRFTAFNAKLLGLVNIVSDQGASYYCSDYSLFRRGDL
jgi:hypothetical protein